MSDKNINPRVALLGTGTMGAGIAERLLDQGFTVDVWNRTPGPATRLAERVATAYTVPSQAVAPADVGVTMLPTADTAKDMMLEQKTRQASSPGAGRAQVATLAI